MSMGLDEVWICDKCGTICSCETIQPAPPNSRFEQLCCSCAEEESEGRQRAYAKWDMLDEEGR